MLPHEIFSKLVRLHKHLNWLESFLMPLLDSNPHLVMAKPLNNLSESLQSSVAFVVKLAVAEELIHCHLFAGFESVLQKGEEDLGYE